MNYEFFQDIYGNLVTFFLSFQAAANRSLGPMSAAGGGMR